MASPRLPGSPPPTLFSTVTSHAFANGTPPKAPPGTPPTIYDAHGNAYTTEQIKSAMARAATTHGAFPFYNYLPDFPKPSAWNQIKGQLSYLNPWTTKGAVNLALIFGTVARGEDGGFPDGSFAPKQTVLPPNTDIPVTIPSKVTYQRPTAGALPPGDPLLPSTVTGTGIANVDRLPATTGGRLPVATRTIDPAPPVADPTTAGRTPASPDVSNDPNLIRPGTTAIGAPGSLRTLGNGGAAAATTPASVPTLPGGGFDLSQGGGSPGPNQYQQGLQQIQDALGKVLGTNYTPAYQAVTAQQVKPDQITSTPQITPSYVQSPFGPKGYQPPIDYERGLSNQINQGMSNNYLGAFLPEAIAQAKALFGNEYGAQIAAQLLSAAQQQNTIQSYNTGANQLLSQLPDSINQDFGSSIALQRGLDRGISQELAGLNPNNAAQAGAAASPDQVANINAQNKESFNTSGAVLGSIGDLNASSLGAQRAAVLASIRQLPLINSLANRQALVANQIGNSNALAKLQTAQAHDVGTASLKIAGTDLAASEKTTSERIGLLKNQQSLDAKYIGQQIGIDKYNSGLKTSTDKFNTSLVDSDTKFNKSAVNAANTHNAVAVQQAQVENAAHALEAISIGTSRQGNAIQSLKFQASLWKAMNPQQTPAQQASAAKYVDSYGSVASGLVPGKAIRVPTMDPADPTKQLTKLGVPQWHTENIGGRRSYAAAVAGLAPYVGGIPQAEAAMSAYYNVGWGNAPGDASGAGRRPLTPQMTEILQKAGQTPDFHIDYHGLPFFTTSQAAALQKGYNSFTSTLQGTKISAADAVKDGLETAAQAQANPSGLTTIWYIPAVR